MTERMRQEPGIIVLRNSLDWEVVVRLEPWADELRLEPGGTVAVEFSGPRGGLEIEFARTAITLFAPEGATLAQIGD